MCGSCYWKARVNDTLIDHERVTRSTEETVSEWEFLASEGYDRTLAAQRMGMSREALCRAIQRHAKKIAQAA